MIDRSQRVAARIFAITYLLTFGIIGVAFSRFYAPFLVWGNDAETARNLIAHEQAFRLYITCAFFYGVGLLVALTSLYVLFRPIRRGMALFAAFSCLLYAVMWFTILLDDFGALRVMSGQGSLRVFEADRLQALAGLQLASGWDAYYIGLTFYSLGTLLFSVLFFQSRYIPRTLAGLAVLASFFQGFCGFAYLIDRSFGSIVSVNWYEIPVGLLEVAVSVWILIRGFRPPGAANTIPASSKNSRTHGG
jgi:hypothetical protein